ncbi:hypothetical protein EG329_004462 [Mollisiaceae sp. DMI_Dod_QoI]|nr:hypothetical protein EG329_004462 [Helotiales sp. DMI_Dod_QoI]
MNTLRNALETDYDMPTEDSWQRSDNLFELLRSYFEQGTTTADGDTEISEKIEASDSQPSDTRETIATGHESSANSEAETTTHNSIATDPISSSPNGPPTDMKDKGKSKQQSIDTVEEASAPSQDTSISLERLRDASEARAAALPQVKILKACTFLLKVAAVHEPLVCKAFGTIATLRYVDIFWDAIAKMEDERTIKVDVFSIDHLTPQDVTFFIALDGCQFKLRYLQWGTLVRQYPNIIDAPQSFLENAPASARGFVQEVQRDVIRSSQMDDNSRLAYYYSRAWALNRGLYRKEEHVEGDTLINPSFIVDKLTSPLPSPSSSYNQVIIPLPTYKQEAYNDHAHPITWYIFQFFDYFDNKYSFKGTLVLGHRPYAEETATGWVDMLKKLELQPIQSKIGFPLYVRIDVQLTGSNIQGGDWLRNFVAPKLKRLKSDLVAAYDDVYLWQYRLAAQGSRSDDTYEASYVLGVKGPEERLHPVFVENVARNWLGYVGKGKDNGHFRILDPIVLTAAQMDEQIYVRCTKQWPYRPMQKPDSVVLNVANNRVKKVHKNSQNANKPSRPLRGADDVLNRLKFDQLNYRVDEWVVGYIDRHLEAVQEKPVIEWATDVSDPAFIPEHRIEYFKRFPPGGKAVILWDKVARINHIFTHHKGKKESEAEEETLTKRERSRIAKDQKDKGKQEENEERAEERKRKNRNGKGKEKEKENQDES